MQQTKKSELKISSNSFIPKGINQNQNFNKNFLNENNNPQPQQQRYL